MNGLEGKDAEQFRANGKAAVLDAARGHRVPFVVAEALFEAAHWFGSAYAVAEINRLTQEDGGLSFAMDVMLARRDWEMLVTFKDVLEEADP